MAQIETWLKTDLKQIVRVQELDGQLFTADNQANLIGVIVTDKGTPVTLSGAVTGYVIRSDGETVIVNGSTSSNKAYIVLPASAYVKAGPVHIVIKVGLTTVCACTGYIGHSFTDTIVDPGHTIPSLEELLAQIENCRTATTNANNAASAANSAAGSANTAASNANSKASAANTAATNATNAASAANTAATNANNKAAAANDAAALANTKAALADEKAALANTKANLANEKATLADQKATAANDAAALANSKAALADEKAALADQKATAANNAAAAANAAAESIDDMTVAASGLSAGASPTVDVSDVSGHKHIAFGIPKGDKGDPGKDFHIQKTFVSIAAMQAYDPDEDQSSHKVHENEFVMIDTGSVQDADTGKLFCYEPETQEVWRYIGDLSGSQGIRGETGTGIANITLNQDYTLTITMDDGTTSYTTPSIRGAQGEKGETPDFQIGTVQTGAAGSSAAASISGTAEQPVLNLTIPQGIKGDPGDDGVSPSVSVSKVGRVATIEVTDGSGTTSVDIEDGTATDEQVADAVSDWLDDHPEATTTVRDGSITNAKLHQDVQDQIAVEENDSESYFHSGRNISLLEVNGNSQAFSTIHLASRKNMMPMNPAYSSTKNGLTVGFSNRFVTISGEASKNTNFLWGDNITNFLIDGLVAGTYKIYAIIDGTYSNASNTYFKLFGRKPNDNTDYSLKTCYFNGYTEKDWSFTIDTTYEKVQLIFSSSTISVTGTLNIWIGLFPSDVTVTDTQTSVASDESETVVVDPTDYPNGIDTMQHTSVSTYHPTIKQYIDSHEINIDDKLVYTTPEAFGAKGDDDTDDSVAINACINYALEKGIPVRGFGNYKIASQVVIAGDFYDIYLHSLRYTGSDQAVWFSGRFCRIQIDYINSQGRGMYITSDEIECSSNTITVTRIISTKDCVYIYSSYLNYRNKLFFDDLSTRDKISYSCIVCVHDENSETGYLNEWLFHGGYLHNALWGIRGYLGPDFHIHAASEKLGTAGVDGGLIWSDRGFIPSIEYLRTPEITLYTTVLKLSGEFYKSSTPVYMSNLGVTLDKIDITELTVPSSSGELQSDNMQIKTNFYIQSTAYSMENLTRNLIIWGNRFQFPPFRANAFTVVQDLDMTDQYYHYIIPQKFIAGANARIDLHPTYAANCLDEFVVEQSNGYELDIYDYCGHLIFDGSAYGNGTYKLKAYIVNVQTNPANSNPLKYDMSNQVWTVSKEELIEAPSNSN